MLGRNYRNRGYRSRGYRDVGSRNSFFGRRYDYGYDYGYDDCFKGSGIALSSKIMEKIAKFGQMGKSLLKRKKPVKVVDLTYKDCTHSGEYVSLTYKGSDCK